jgi:hypothetical protein
MANASKQLCCCILLLLLLSCSGGSPTSLKVTPPAPQPSIRVVPDTALVPVGTNAQFFVTVMNLPTAAANWTASVGAIDQSGNYIAPASVPNGGVATVTATSISMPTLSASATVTISSQPVTLSISPTGATVKAGFSTLYTASVDGTSNTTVAWTVNDLPGDNTYPGSITAGVYTAPAPVLATATYSITATSSADPSKTAAASVTAIPLENQVQQSFPIELGTSGVNANAQDCCSGTLGSLLQDQKGRQYILSNNHVIGRVGHASVGEAIVQPGYVDTQCNFAIPKTVATFTAAPSILSNVDAAIAEVVPGAVDHGGGIIGLGGVDPNGSYISAPPASTIASAAIGMQVAKSGRTSGLSCGIVEALNGTVRLDFPAECGNPCHTTVLFQGQVILDSIGTFGDSGSLILDAATAQPVALLAGLSSDGRYISANPAFDVISTLNAVTGSTLSFVGAAQHSISCSNTANLAAPQSQLVSSRSIPPIPPEEVTRAIAIQARYEDELMKNPAVIGVAVSRSLGDAKRASLLVFVERGRERPVLPAQLDDLAVQVVSTGRSLKAALPRPDGPSTCAHHSPTQAIYLGP